jgi:hypothetical protein
VPRLDAGSDAVKATRDEAMMGCADGSAEEGRVRKERACGRICAAMADSVGVVFGRRRRDRVHFGRQACREAV